MWWDRALQWLSAERDRTGAVADDADGVDVGSGTDAPGGATSSDVVDSAAFGVVDSAASGAIDPATSEAVDPATSEADGAASSVDDAPGVAANSVAIGGRDASRDPRGVTATDGGNAAATDGSGTPQWTGDDPISFEAGETRDRDAVVRPEDVVEDPIDFDAGDADALLDAVAVDDVDSPNGGDDEPSSVGSSGAEGREEAADAGRSTADGPGRDGTAADDPERDGSDRAVDESAPVAVEGPDAGTRKVAVDALRDRLESVEDDHERVTTSVAELESEMEGLHDQVDGVRANLETLVDLVRETAATRGGGAAAAASGAGQTTSPSPTADEPTPAEGAASPSSTEESGAAAEEPSSAESGPTSASSSTDDTTSSSHADDPTASTPSPGAPAADPDDPRSDAAAERLRDLGAAFEADEGVQRHVDPDRLDDATEAGDAAGGGGSTVGDEVDPAGDRVSDVGDEAGAGADGVADVGGEASAGTDGAADVGGEADAGTDGVADVDDEPGEEAEDAADERVALADRSEAASSLAATPDLGGFEFQKVVLPAEDGGEPEFVGDDLAPPYLGAVPDGYAAEAAVIEWLDGLVEAADESTALAALAYYESVGWLTAEVRAAIARYLVDVQAVDVPSAPTGPPDGLDAADHRRSLEFVVRLAEDGADDGAYGDVGVSADGI